MRAKKGKIGLQTMKIKVLLFASFREAAGISQSTVEIAPGAAISDVWEVLVDEHPRLAPHSGTAAYAINGTYAKPGETVSDGDEVAFLPPVSGG
jgi:sulfur-carrier protein